MDNQNHYIVLARRTRPQSFSELVGQEVVAQSMTSMVEGGRIPHAFLFTGTRGTGKTSSARILAKSLCCEKGPTANPCQVCVHCTQITACAHDDVLEIDGASNTGVDNVRELNEAARFYPHSARYKIFIIDEVHMLSTGAFNALLKTLEEPPNQVIFILATTELHKVPITVRSRCMIFSFKKIETAVIENHLKSILLKEQISFEDDAVQIVAREAKGSLRDSLSLLEQAIAVCGNFLTTEKTKSALCVQGEELAERLFSAICLKKTAEALMVLQESHQANVDCATLIENTASLFRSAILVKNLGDKERTLRLAHLLSKEYDFLEQESQGLSHAALSEIFKALSSSVRELGRTTAPLAWAEMVVVDCVVRADWLSVPETLSLLQKKNNETSGSQFKLIPPARSTNETKQAPQNQATPQPQPQSQPSHPSENHSQVQAQQAQVNQNKTENHSLPVDMDLFKKWIEAIKIKSEILATKLTFVKMNQFNVSKIEFADTQENATFLSLSEQDIDLFWQSLSDIGLEKTPVSGKHRPPLKTKPILENKENLNKQSEKPRPLQTHAVQNSAKAMMKNFQKFSPAAQAPKEPAKNISLNEVLTEEKLRAREEKSKKIMAQDGVKLLSQIATEIQIEELRPTR